MEGRKTNALKSLFIAVFIISCLSISSNNLEGYFSCHTKYLYLKFIVIIVSVFITASLLKNHSDFLAKASAMIIPCSLLVFIFDSLITQIGGTALFYRIWWLASMFLAEGALFLSLSVFRKGDYKKNIRTFWMGFSSLYLVTFFLVFLRKPHSHKLSVNLIPTKGTIGQIKYIFPNGREAIQIVSGNLFVFLPLPILIKAFFPKIKNSVLLLIGLMVPICIESYQYIFKCGNVDIDDIILNFGGFLIGFLINSILEKKLKNHK